MPTTTQQQTTASATPDKNAQFIKWFEPEETATLNCRVRRCPASLGNMFYHLDRGTKVYVINRTSDGFAIVSTVPQRYRIAEDKFRVSGLALREVIQ